MTTRFQLTTAAVAVLLVANAMLSLVGVLYLERVYLGEVQTRVRLDLNSARSAYAAYGQRIEHFLRAAALDDDLRTALAKQDRTAAGALAHDLYTAAGTDFLAVVDPQGRVLTRGRSQNTSDNATLQNPLVRRVLERKEPLSGTIELTREQLAAEDQGLAELAHFALRPTPAARPTDDTTRTGGLAVAAAVPIVNRRGELLGALVAGDLLNRRFEMVDAIKDDVFAWQGQDDADIGTVTIFHHDLRIATNVKTPDGNRAVGTRLSEAVAEEVLERGGVWSGPAFVVSDRYLAAYEPIRDPDGKVVGALYVGLLEAPFAQQQRTITAAFLLMVVLATVASLALLFLVSTFILRPVRRIVAMAERIVRGDLSARVKARPPGEMGVICQAVDRMADAVAEREEELKQVTRQQIGRSEQLAAIGRLAAGVAHEINNPLTGVLTFAYLLRDKANMDAQDKEDLDVIIRETSRAAEIVKGLLDFARERPPQKEPLDINEVVHRTIRLIRNQKPVRQIEIEQLLQEDLPLVDGDMNQLQQVVLNLTLNACEAMGAGGKLTIATSAIDGKVRVRLNDTGPGIKKEHLPLIFEPFFTTKPVGKGTGLGLSVSYGIIQQHGGTIEVESSEGHGATFCITLPGIDLSTEEKSMEWQAVRQGGIAN